MSHPGVCRLLPVKGNGEPTGIETAWEAALLLNIGRAAFVFPALPRKGNPGTSLRVNFESQWDLHINRGRARRFGCPQVVSLSAGVLDSGLRRKDTLGIQGCSFE